MPLLAVTLRELLRRRCRFGMLCEGSNPLGVKGLIKRFIYRVHNEWFWDRFDFILSMGSAGVDWFSGRGYPRVRLFPFAYITEGFPAVPISKIDKSGPVKLVFVGQCIRRKGIDLAVRALGDLRDLDWTFNIIGEGPCRQSLETLTRRFRIGDRVSFSGVLPNEAAVLTVASADLLILPSRHDGWGAVINEALMQGVPVICSDRCGARDLVRSSSRGQVFRSESVPELREALRSRLARGKVKAGDREEIRLWSRCVAGRSASTYFLDVMQHVYNARPRPVAPWV